MQGQPEVQPGFAVQHQNPYAQQPQGYQQPQAYQPPAQYGEPQPPLIVVDNGQQPAIIDHATIVAINQIDQHLSSGCYSCYKCWLLVIAIAGILSFLSALRGFSFQNMPQFLFGVSSLVYATTMMDALSNKDAKKASSGICYAVVVLIFNSLALFFRSLYLEYHGGKDEAPFYVYAIGPAIFYDLLIVLMPAVKIQGHLERRNALLKGTQIAA